MRLLNIYTPYLVCVVRNVLVLDNFHAETLEATERQMATMHEQLREMDSLESAKLDLRIQLDSANSELQEAIRQQGHMVGEVASVTEERDFVHLDFEEASCRVRHLEDELSGALSMCEQERMTKNWLIEDVEEETASLIRNHQGENVFSCLHVCSLLNHLHSGMTLTQRAGSHVNPSLALDSTNV